MNIQRRIESLENKMLMQKGAVFHRLIIDSGNRKTDDTLRHSACDPEGDCKKYLNGVKKAQERGSSGVILIICNHQCEFRRQEVKT